LSESTLGSFKQLLVGKPIPSHLAHHQRFSKKTGLAILSSDAMSSVAYATEEIVRTLIVAGVAALSLATPIGAVIALLLIVVAISYRQTIFAYPGGGGAYIVAKENLGDYPGLIAGAALLIDYVLTVAVSVAAGVAAVTSAFPEWHINRVELALGFVTLLTVGNLRGIRESGRIFAVPTYFFLLCMLAMIALGAWRFLSGTIQPLAVEAPLPEAGQAAAGLSTFLILRAFANGCTAMTGVEAVSNGVPQFKPPEARNAAATLMIMAGLCVTLFMGITLLAHAYGVVPREEETVVSQLARGILGGRGPFYYMLQAGTMLILVLAANTAYSGFPGLASIIARDRYLPRQFTNQGDRLAFSNGIIVLSVLAGMLLVFFRGDTHSLIPLYMIGVFVSFTLSQTGMVLKWRRDRAPRWQANAAWNAVGGVLTGLVLIVVAVTKFMEGAWIVLALVPLLVLWFRSVHKHYERVGEQLSLKNYALEPRRGNTVLIPIGGVHRAVVSALQYSLSLSADVRAVYVDVNPQDTVNVKREWEKWGQGTPLVILESPFRSLMEPLLEYIEAVDNERPDDFVTIVLPEFVPAKWWHHLLHNQRALLIKGALLFKPNTVVTSVPFHLRG
jgi:amino acid transporter